MRRLPLYGRQGKFTFRLLAVALFGQSVILSFFALVARGNAIAAGEPESGGRLLWLGLGLALLALVASGLMRSPVGITLGWLVQVLTWVSAFVVPVMVGVAVVFTLLWVVLLLQGLKIDTLVAGQERKSESEEATAEETAEEAAESEEAAEAESVEAAEAEAAEAAEAAEEAAAEAGPGARAPATDG